MTNLTSAQPGARRSSERWLQPEHSSRDAVPECDGGSSPIFASANSPLSGLDDDDGVTAMWARQGSVPHHQSQLPCMVSVPVTTPEHFTYPAGELSAQILDIDDYSRDSSCITHPHFSLDPSTSSPAPRHSLATGLVYCPIPWPDDMLISPRRQFLWQYFLHTVEEGALCLDLEDVRHVPGFQDPFVATLPRMALASPALRGAVLCFSMFQYKASCHQQNLDSAMRLAWQEACQVLHAQLVELDWNDGEAVLAMLSACCALHWCTPPKRDDYLRLAIKIAIAFLGRFRLEATISSTCRDLILTSFRWTTISALCSLRPPSSLLSDNLCELIEVDCHEIEQNFSTQFQSWVSHPMYAFSLRLVNPLLRIGHLAELHRSSLAGKEGHEARLEHKVSTLESMLLNAREVDLDATNSTPTPADPSSVVSVNEAMHAACVILFYTRLRSLPFTAPLIRLQVRIVVNEISKTRIDSRVSYASFFPLFIAGCEAVDTELRHTIEERLRMPKGLYFGRGNIVDALRHIWDIRDLQPGLIWPHWVEKSKWRSL